MKKTTKYEATAIITVLVLSIVTSCLEISYATNQESLNPTSEANSNFSIQASSGKVGIKEHKITSAELGKLKSEVGVYEEGHNYNRVVDSHGTGLSPPTSDEWEDIAKNAYVVDNISYQSIPSAVDQSATPWFPPIERTSTVMIAVASYFIVFSFFPQSQLLGMMKSRLPLAYYTYSSIIVVYF